MCVYSLYSLPQEYKDTSKGIRYTHPVHDNAGVTGTSLSVVQNYIKRIKTGNRNWLQFGIEELLN